MKDINNSSYVSRLRTYHPREKIFTTVISLGVALLGPMPLAPLGITLWMITLLCLVNKTPIRRVLQLMGLPMAFMSLSVFTIVFHSLPQAAEPIFALQLGTSTWGISSHSLQSGLAVFMRAIASLCCLYFLLLTTTLTSILTVFKTWHMPTLILELMQLTYKMIFILYDTARHVYQAQRTRLGYLGIRSSFRDMGVLATMTFIRAIKRSEALYTALEARGYNGEIRVLDEPYQKSKWWYWTTASVALLILLIALLFSY